MAVLVLLAIRKPGHPRRCRWLVPNGSIGAAHATTATHASQALPARIVQGRLLQKTRRPVDGFLPSRATSCSAHAGHDVTASQARLHAGGEAAIPSRSSQPRVGWGVSLRWPLLPQYPSGSGIVPAGEHLGEVPDWWRRWISWVRGACPSGQNPTRLAVCPAAEQDLIRDRLVIWKLGVVLSKRLFWGFKTTTGDGMI